MSRASRNRMRAGAILVLFVAGAVAAAQSGDEGVRETARSREIVFISDLHMGLGKDAETGEWHPTEDFRWPRALAAFLSRMSEEGGDAVDLVIAGDFLELWQPPPGVACSGPEGRGATAAEWGCTVGEMETITRAVIAAHESEFRALAAFAQRGKNCLHIMPGNHDSSLLLDGVWLHVARALQAESGCVERVGSGIWTSPDGRVVAEHGHQIGVEANRYPQWPGITREIDGRTYIFRPVGERLVQKLFNDTEAEFPLIDNLSPHSAGVKYRRQARSALGDIADVGRVLKFFLLDTTLRQAGTLLGESGPGPAAVWEVAEGRRLGHRLFLNALDSDDPMIEEIEGSEEFRNELDRLAGSQQELPDNEVRALCARAAARKEGICQRGRLGQGGQRLLFSRAEIVGPYVEGRRRDHRAMSTFVYGHTHSFELNWEVPSVQVEVLNDGAFQRVIDDARLRQLAAEQGISPAEFLRTGPLEELPACYTFVRIRWEDERPVEELAAWYMPEDGRGRTVSACDQRLCPNVGHGCSVE